MSVPDPIRILSRQLLAIREQADAALELLGMILQDDGDMLDDSGAPALPKVFGGVAGQPDEAKE